jgi:hypothetical protein
MSWFRRPISTAWQEWPYGLRCSRCQRVLVGSSIQMPAFQRLDIWSSILTLQLVFEVVCDAC